MVESVLIPYQKQGIFTDIYTIVGSWDKNRVYTIATMKHWDERSISQKKLIENCQICQVLRYV
jgi:hypothetical protein